MSWFESESNRALLYRLCLALIPLLAVLDLLTGEVADQLLRSAQIVLGVGASGLATRNTSRHSP